MQRWRWVVLCSLAWVGLAASSMGCAPHIGDHCSVNSDCSLQGTLQCDTSQTNGYCTQFNCAGNSCPNSSSCVAVSANVPGCPYDDYTSPSRTAVTMCLENCSKDSDCRTGEGYVCRDPADPPWNAPILDNTQHVLVCVPNPTYDTSTFSAPDATPPVCSVAGPLIDGSVFSSAVPSPDASGDAGAGALDAGGDGAANASDAGAADAPGGG